MNARTLMLEFMDWGYRTPPAIRKGSKLRAIREKEKRKFLDALFRKTPNYPPSRQVRRRLVRT